MKINIAIDGPSAAGKSSIAKILAQRLDYVHLDTGSMYRTVAYCATKKGIKLDNEEKIVEMIHQTRIEVFPDGTILVNGHHVNDEIRTNEMSMGASDVSKHAKVREAMVKMQQDIAKDGGYILDGRDIGTVVLKDAAVKIFLTASAEERAKRRVEQNKKNGIPFDYDAILKDIKQRDWQDTHREHSPLTKASDAVEIDSSFMTIEEVVDAIMEIVETKIK